MADIEILADPIVLGGRVGGPVYTVFEEVLQAFAPDLARPGGSPKVSFAGD